MNVCYTPCGRGKFLQIETKTLEMLSDSFLKEFSGERKLHAFLQNLLLGPNSTSEDRQVVSSWKVILYLCSKVHRLL
jgi:hypothetical protein